MIASALPRQPARCKNKRINKKIFYVFFFVINETKKPNKCDAVDDAAD